VVDEDPKSTYSAFSGVEFNSFADISPDAL
jgi:hypothetical protein